MNIRNYFLYSFTFISISLNMQCHCWHLWLEKSEQPSISFRCFRSSLHFGLSFKSFRSAASFTCTHFAFHYEEQEHGNKRSILICFWGSSVYSCLQAVVASTASLGDFHLGCGCSVGCLRSSVHHQALSTAEHLSHYRNNHNDKRH